MKRAPKTQPATTTAPVKKAARPRKAAAAKAAAPTAPDQASVVVTLPATAAIGVPTAVVVDPDLPDDLANKAQAYLTRNNAGHAYDQTGDEPDPEVVAAAEARVNADIAAGRLADPARA